MSKITHEEALQRLAGAFTPFRPPEALRSYIREQQAREAADTALLERCLEALTHLGAGEWLIAEPLRARLGKENSNGN